MIPVRIVSSASLLPGRPVDTESLVRASMPGRDAAALAARVGIRERYWAGPEDTVAEVGARALRAALESAGMPASALKRVILVNSHAGDHPIPATVNDLVDHLDPALNDLLGGFDLNNACTGFVSGFDVAARMVATGEAPVAVVAVELLSRWIAPEVPRSYVVLGDAAAAFILDTARGPGAVLASDFGNDGRKREAVIQAHGGTITFGASGQDFARYAVDGLATSIRRVLALAGKGVGDIDWWAFHQPNGELLDAIVSTLEIPPERTVRTVEDIGSVGSASAACTLDRLLAERPVEDGQLLMLSAVGAGASRGAVLLRMER